MEASPASTAGESPGDRALGSLIAAEPVNALRWAIPLADSDQTQPLGTYVVGAALAALGEQELAARALDVCVTYALGAGNIALSIAACTELARLGKDQSALAERVAEAFARGSARLSADGAKPPRLPDQQKTIAPLDSEERAELVTAAEDLVGKLAQAAPKPSSVSPHALFSMLDAESLGALIRILETTSVPQGQVLIEQGTTGAEAFIVARGELEVVRQGGDKSLRLARLGNGSLLGEMALLSRAPRAASVIACRPTVALVARKEALEEAARQHPNIAQAFAEHCRARMIENLLRASSILSAVHPRERHSLVNHFVTRTYETGDTLIRQGSESEGLHLVASGEVSVIHREGDDSTVIAKLGPGEVVGEVALVLRRPSNADVIASHPTVTLHLPRDSFLDVIRAHPALLARLYELAVQRDEETSSIVAQEAAEVDDLVLL